MKKYLILLIACFLITNAYSQRKLTSKNRHDSIAIDKTIDGIWGNNGTDPADSTYLLETGLPNFGDLHYPDLELKIKSLWYRSKVYFLVRHIDDSLVNGYINNTTIDDSVKDGLENRDATAFYFYLDTNSLRLDYNSEIYDANSSYIDSIAWIRWVWGADDFEGELGDSTITTIDSLGGEFIQWKDDTDDNISYAKFSIDIQKIAPHHTFIDYTIDTATKDTIFFPSIKLYHQFGFEVELDENDKEVLDTVSNTFGIQTRAFWAADQDSLSRPFKPTNVSRWGWLYFTLGDEFVSSVKSQTINSFASLYPNPASDYINVQFEEYNEAEYRMFDLMGQTVKTGYLNGYNGSISVSNVNPGSYYLQFINKKGGIMTSKILILR